MKKTYLLLFCILLLIIAFPNRTANSSVGESQRFTGQSPSASIQPRIVAADESALRIALDVPLPVITAEASCSQISLEGWGSTVQPGWPQLPQTGTLVGIPAGSDPSVRLVESQEEIITLSAPPCLVERPHVVLDPNGLNIEPEEGTAADPNYLASTEAYPSQVVVNGGTALIRNQHVLQVGFQPFHYNPLTGQLHVYRNLVAAVEFNAPALSLHSPAQAVTEGFFEPMLADGLLNYEQAKAWRAEPVSDLANNVQSTSTLSPAYKILVNQDGFYQITYDALQAAGVPVDAIDPRTLRMFVSGTGTGEEMALRVIGQEDGKFDAADLIVFYGQQNRVVLSDTTTVYWLTWGGANGLRMSEVLSAPAGGSPIVNYQNLQHLEQNTMYQLDTPSGPENDRWYWDLVYSIVSPPPVPVPVTSEYTFEIANLDPVGGKYRLKGLLKGYAATIQHHAQIKLNGTILVDKIWPSGTEYAFDVDLAMFPVGTLKEGTNTIQVVLPMDVYQPTGYTRDVVFINYFEVTYLRKLVAQQDLLDATVNAQGNNDLVFTGFSADNLEIYDLTIQTTPQLLTGETLSLHNGRYSAQFSQNFSGERRFLALLPEKRLTPLQILADQPSDLRATTNSADYLMISHADFIPDLQPLADYHNKHGLRVAVVDVQDIYDEFGTGVSDPEAIRAFIDYAYHKWTLPAPSYVLLVGDSTYDFKHYTTTETNFLPAYLADVDPWIREVPADNRYVTVSGSDILPDLYLGRFVVHTPADVKAIVDKILVYVQSPPGGGMNGKALFVADNADAAGDFAGSANLLADHMLPAAYPVNKVYHTVTHATVAATRQGITDAIHDGRLLVHYTGHAGQHTWAGENLLGVFNLNGDTRFTQLSNTGKYPFFMGMDCLEGYYLLPVTPKGVDASSFAELLQRAENRGSIASFSPTGEGTVPAHDVLSEALFIAIFQNNMTRLGQSTTQARLSYAAQVGPTDSLIDTFLLFGDPAMHLSVLNTPELPTAVDLTLDMTLTTAQPIISGQTISYEVTFRNTSARIADHLVLAHALPPQLTAVSTSITTTDSKTHFTLRPGTPFTWDIDVLPPGASGTVTIKAQVPEDFDGMLDLTGSVFANTYELDFSKNETALQVEVLPPLQLTMQLLSPRPILIGDTVTYRLDYQNNTGVALDTLVIATKLPAQFGDATYTFTGPQVTQREGPDLAWNIALLQPGAGGSITVQARLKEEITAPLTVLGWIFSNPSEIDYTKKSISLQILAPDRLSLPLLFR